MKEYGPFFPGEVESTRDLSQPYHRFRCLYLTEERASIAELVMPPMLEQAHRLWGNQPLGRIRQSPPLAHALAQLIDDRVRVVLLFGVRKTAPFIEDHLLLVW